MAMDEDLEKYVDDPLDIDHDELIGFISARNAEDAERASSAGESRQKIGEFLEETGIHGKALSVGRGILKMKKKTQQMDVIRSFEAMIPEIKAHVFGQSTPDMFDEKAKKADQPVDFADPKDDAPVDDETADLNDQVDQITGKDGNIVPFGDAG